MDTADYRLNDLAFAKRQYQEECIRLSTKLAESHRLLLEGSEYMHKQACEMRDMRKEFSSITKNWQILTALWFSIDVVELVLHWRGLW